MKIIVRFKTGFELPVTCDKFNITKNPYTDEIGRYDIEGTKDNLPLFFRSEDIECIYGDVTSDEAD